MRHMFHLIIYFTDIVILIWSICMMLHPASQQLLKFAFRLTLSQTSLPWSSSVREWSHSRGQRHRTARGECGSPRSAGLRVKGRSAHRGRGRGRGQAPPGQLLNYRVTPDRPHQPASHWNAKPQAKFKVFLKKKEEKSALQREKSSISTSFIHMAGHSHRHL